MRTAGDGALLTGLPTPVAPTRLIRHHMRKSSGNLRNPLEKSGNLYREIRKSGMSDPVFLGVPTTPNINSTATISVLCYSADSAECSVLTHHHRSRISIADKPDIAEAAAPASAVVAIISLNLLARWPKSTPQTPEPQFFCQEQERPAWA